MYSEFFGLRELPFNNTPDPRFFYSTPDHEEALASLIYAVKQRKGFVLLTGEVGAGKTLVSRMMLRHFGTEIAFANINHTLHSAGDLMESLCLEFELPVETGMSHTQLMRALHDFLLTKFAQNLPVVLILDEAQNLPIVAFEQLRMIGNLEADDAKLLQIAIVGQPELQGLFQSPQLRQLKQRVFRSFHLPALSRKATEGYIRYRLSVAASGRNDLFTPRAVDKIFEVSRGLPRLINTLCDNAMLSAYSADLHRVDEALIESVVSQMMMIGGPQPGPVAAPRPQADWSVQLAADPSAQPYGVVTSPFAVGVRQSIKYPWDATRQAQVLAIASSSTEGAGPPASACRGHVHVPAPHRPPGDSLSVTVDESSRRRGELRARLTKTLDRIRALERSAGGVGSELSILNPKAGGSDSTVRNAESVLGRVQAASQDLVRREEKLRGLSTTVGTAAAELGRMLERLQEASAQSRREKRSAQEIHDRLVQQAENAQRIAEMLKKSTPVADTGRGTDEPRATVIKAASASADVTTGPGDRVDAVRSTSEPLHRALSDTRESLSDLRNLARGTGNGRAGADKGSTTTTPATTEDFKTPPTTRLTHQVEDLVAMLEQ